MTTTRTPVRRATVGALRACAVVVAVLCAVGIAGTPAQAQAPVYRAISGSGSTWSANMIEQWASDVRQFGVSVGFAPVGSSSGRNEFRSGTVDFAVSEIPYGLTDAQGTVDSLPDRGFAYLPIVAGGTSFMYNLKVAGQPVTNLRLSGETLARIFTGAITKWDDPAILDDNPNLALPNRDVVVVVRSDGSGTTAQFTEWMSKQHSGIWTDFCNTQGVTSSGSCGFTSFYPVAPGFLSQNGSLGVSGYVAQPTAEGSITYVEYSYALRNKFPVAKVLNAAGNYVEPTDQAVAVSLLKADIETDRSNPATYLTQKLDGVYNDTDPRSYPLSSYSYMIIPTAEGGGELDQGKANALGDFLQYSICEGQQSASVLGYSPLPQNLVRAGFDQIGQIPGFDPDTLDLAACNNPTFSPDGTNTLADTAPQPPACDRQGTSQCSEGTAGANRVPTAVTRGTGPTGEQAAGGGGDGGGDGGGGDGGTGGGAGGTGGGTAAGGPGGSADPVVVPVAGDNGDPGDLGDAGVFVDPETGEIIGGGGNTGVGAAAGVAAVSGIPVSAPGGGGWTTQHTLMVLAALSLLAATVGPPLIGRQMARRQ